MTRPETQGRIVIENPVPGVLHSLQTGDIGMLDPKRSKAGEPLASIPPSGSGPAQILRRPDAAGRPDAGLRLYPHWPVGGDLARRIA